MRKTYFIPVMLFLTVILFTSCRKWDEKVSGDLIIVSNEGGSTIVYSKSSGIKLIYEDQFAFKDLNKNDTLDNFEDWRLPVNDRAKDLASKLSIEEIAGLMLYSPHQSIPSSGSRFGRSTYKGKSFEESGALSSDLSDQQVEFLTKDKIRHILVTAVESPEVAATWNNKVQALCENLGFGIPANNSSDPRHQAVSTAEYNVGSEGQISMWPNSLGMAATFDPEVIQRFGEIASKEYRAMGITTALSPQIDLATEPRWSRFNGTFGENPLLSADLARAYIDGFQTSKGEDEIDKGWGFTSVNTMVKHWPGGGTGEGGRDAHFSFGKYAVYPGGDIPDHYYPFTRGALNLRGPTEISSAVMPYYTISYGQDTRNNENVGNSYSSYFINDLLRGTFSYKGVVCTDWGVTKDNPSVNNFGTTPWGVESLTVTERHYKAIMAGVDQFGGNNEAEPIVEAYKLGVKEHGEVFMRKRFEESAVRILKNIFRPGLFENPYLDIQKTKSTIGNPDFMKAGYEAQLRSVVMLKNKNKVLPLKKDLTAYIPKRFTAQSVGFFGNIVPESTRYPLNMEIAGKYFRFTDNTDEADFGLVVIRSPMSGSGYDVADVKKGGNGYIPISLQYGTYKAVFARERSIAGGDPLENFTNRSYKNKSVTASNISDLNMVLETRKIMKGKPVVVVIEVNNPMVLSEFENQCDAILVTFGVQDQAVLDVLSGNYEPSGLLPFQMPADMKTVELQNEDIPLDMTCHKDSEGNVYNFGYGMNWGGVIRDDRTIRYVKSR